MSLFSYLLGKPQQSQTSFVTSDIKERKKLQKPRTLNASRRSAVVDTDFFDVFLTQSCLIMQSVEEETPEIEEPEHRPHIGSLISSDSSISTVSTLSIQDNSSISSNSTANLSQTEKMAPFLAPARLPRRAKTPVMFVGQLESHQPLYDPAQAFARQYSDLLPPRSFTPAIEEQLVKPQRRSIRKIKCQQSLRDLVKEQSRSPRSSSSSDCDTLVGTESPKSPRSPIEKGFPEIARLQLIDKPPPRPQALSKKASLDIIKQLHDVIGLDLCTNLLTNELATALLQQYPSEHQDQASGPQIRLMIEAYEILQEHVRRELYDAFVNGQELDSHVQEIEVNLERWLDSLYDLYDTSQKKASCEVIREVEEEYEWPLRRSEDSANTYVSC
jgi:hypothetical protein